jgi:Family of unknown function (DUF6516)
MAKATLLLDFRATQGELLMQMVLWQLPRATKDRPHGLKYRLYLGRSGQTQVRYDNETGKGDHRHVGADEVQVAYEFSSLEELLNDFRVECEQLGWRWSE